MPRLAPISLLALLTACGSSPPQGQTPYTPTAAMLSVLQERQAMHAKELSGLSVAEARTVPNLIDAAEAIPNVKGLPATFTDVPNVTQVVANGAQTPLGARLYQPASAKNTPIIIYFVGGTWVTGNLDTYEETARQLAARTGYIVVSIRTRIAPEARFPAAHDDAFAAYQWARAHMREWGADPTRVVLAGEGPGANLAISTALLARDHASSAGPVPLPDQLLLITPVAGTDLSTPSMSENRRSQPLTRATVDWAQWEYARRHLDDPRINIAARTDFSGLPPTTIVLAEIDPLRSGGEELEAKLQAAGVKTNVRTFPGTTYDFFSLATQVPEAEQAEEYATNILKAAFYQPPPAPPASRTRPRR